jgi:glutamate-1-semialdehyde 2,1-aminomutase
VSKFSIRLKIKEIANTNNLDVDFFGMPSLTRFVIKDFEERITKTYITREMLNLNYLASNLIYVSTAHTEKIRDKYFEDLNQILKNISSYSNYELSLLLKEGLAGENFRRLN